MSQSLSKILTHIIFSTKDRAPFLRKDELRKELYKYLGGICNNMGSDVISVGGYYDHVHIFCRLSKNHSASKLIMELKKESSKWIKLKDPSLKNFAWQNGYGIFSIGESQGQDLVNYIQNQEEHHRKRTFQEEYVALLIKYKINYDERYVWN